jgi:hypothetical protein
MFTFADCIEVTLRRSIPSVRRDLAERLGIAESDLRIADDKLLEVMRDSPESLYPEFTTGQAA